jgi:acetylornithine deacetylase/succinyl-diaminopimelate desuccinylase-like protein
LRILAFRPALVALALCAAAPASLPAQSLTPEQALAREIFAQLIGLNTTDTPKGGTGQAAQALAQRYLAAGFPDSDVAVVGSEDRYMNVVVRLHGTGARPPVLYMAHLDVVEALPQDWSFDPFTLTEQDGYFYGRGTSDIKDMAAIFAANIIRLKQEGFVPDRDFIVALTADEENGDHNGIAWLLANRKDLIDAAYAINGDAGDPISDKGKVYARAVQAGEKVYMDLSLEVHNVGGHSSVPVKDNAIYRLAAGLTRLSKYTFPARLNEVSRSYFERAPAGPGGAPTKDMRLAAKGDTAAIRRLSASSPVYNSQFRTTCVATRLEGGHANNALPQTAKAIVNCRILPDEKLETVVNTIRRVVADTAIKVTVLWDPVPSPPSPLVPEVLGPIERVTKAVWPGVPVVPIMETGATDGLYLRNAGMPVYGVSGVATDADDIRAHGKDERIRVAAFYTGLDFTYRLMRELGTSPTK